MSRLTFQFAIAVISPMLKLITSEPENGSQFAFAGNGLILLRVVLSPIFTLMQQSGTTTNYAKPLPLGVPVCTLSESELATAASLLSPFPRPI